MKHSPIDILNLFFNNGVEFFTGVPDSTLKEFCLCITDNVSSSNHIIAANEGNAVAIAAGYHFATGKLPFVYMQNSGLGNAVNPLLSLCDPAVFSVPLLVMIGWRGEPGTNDAVQHAKDGRIIFDILQSMEIPFVIISEDDDMPDVEAKLRKCTELASSEKRPVAIVVKSGTFAPYCSQPHNDSNGLLLREETLEIILAHLSQDCIVITTTGRTSSELFELREKLGQPHFQDFLAVGSMGHCSSIALGIALQKPNIKVICIDGDGALIMHLGALATIGMMKPNNLKHILINNGVHESVGGQATAAKYMNMPDLARALGYQNIYSCRYKLELLCTLGDFLNNEGLSFLEVVVKPGARSDLGRSTISPIENKNQFMSHLKEI